MILSLAPVTGGEGQGEGAHRSPLTIHLAGGDQ